MEIWNLIYDNIYLKITVHLHNKTYGTVKNGCTSMTYHLEHIWSFIKINHSKEKFV